MRRTMPLTAVRTYDNKKSIKNYHTFRISTVLHVLEIEASGLCLNHALVVLFLILQATFLMLNLKNNSADFEIEIKNKMIS